MRPGAAELLQHQWIAETRRTLKKSWTGGSAFLSRGRGGQAPGVEGATTEAHESVYSVVNRMLAAEDSDPTAVQQQQLSQQQQQQRAGVAVPPGGTPSPSLPGLPAAAAASMAAAAAVAVSPLRDGRVLLSTAGSVPLPPLPPAAGSRDMATTSQASPMYNAAPPSGGGGGGGTPTHHQSVGAPSSSLSSASGRPQQQQLGGMLASLQVTVTAWGGLGPDRCHSLAFSSPRYCCSLSCLTSLQGGGGGTSAGNQQSPAWLDASEVGIHMARRGTAESVAAAAGGISFSVPPTEGEDRFGDAGPSREIKIKVRAHRVSCQGGPRGRLRSR